MPSGFSKEELLSAPVLHIDIKQLNIVPLIDQMSDTAFQARNLARAASIVAVSYTHLTLPTRG